jgi:hypothetical protein
MPPAAKKKFLKQNPLAGRTVPPFHDQHPKEHGWPVGVPNSMRAKLLEGYELAGQQPWVMHVALKNDKELPLDAHGIVKRFHGVHVLKWYKEKQSNAQPGDVLRWKEGMQANLECASSIRQNFTNVAFKKETLHEGTVHVAVGFNDLSLIVHSELNPSPSGRRGPLRFVGMDTSPRVVAKCKVIAGMVADSGTPLAHVIQAWCSVSWSRSCLASFRRCLDRVLTSLEQLPDSSVDSRVMSHLRHWFAEDPMSVAKARTEFTNLRVGAHCTAANFKRQNDRMALTHYYLTGDWLATTKEEPDVGSMTMWVVPEGSPAHEDNEFAHGGFGAVNLWDEIQNHGDCTIIEAMTRLMLRDLTRLRLRIQEKKVVIELECTTIGVASPAVQRIVKLRPWTMSWSNVLDYFRPSEFHKLARACGGKGTVHYGHSMNWASETIGTCLLDYDGNTTKDDIIDHANKAQTTFGRLTEIDQFLVLPLHENPYNATQVTLGSRCAKNWGQYFFSTHLAVGSATFLEEEIHTFSFDPLTSANATVRLVWTYDMEISLQVSNDMCFNLKEPG